jgi:hypothetical protein
MLPSDPATKKAASAKAETWRQGILDICPISLPIPPVASKTRIFMFNLDLS